MELEGHRTSLGQDGAPGLMSQALLLLHSCFGLSREISPHSQQGYGQQGYGQQGISAGATADSQKWCMTFPAADSWKAGGVERSPF